MPRGSAAYEAAALASRVAKSGATNGMTLSVWARRVTRLESSDTSEERPFFGQQRPQGAGIREHRPRRASISAPERASERPPIEQQEGEGQGDEHRLRGEPHGKEADRRQIAAGAGATDMVQVGGHGEQPEQSRKDVLALCGPGHRLHPQRVQGEQCSHGGGAPEGAGQRQQHREQQDGVGRVDPGAHEVVPPRPEPEYLGIEPCGRARSGDASFRRGSRKPRGNLSRRGRPSPLDC